MPYSDPDRQRQAQRESARRCRAQRGQGLDPLELPDDGDEPPTRDQLLRALGVQARKGNVAAIRLLLAEYRRDEDDVDQGGVLDQLDGESTITRLAKSRHVNGTGWTD